MNKVRTGFLNSSYKTMAKDHDDALTTAELIKLVQPPDLLQLTHQHNRPDCIVLWIRYDSLLLFASKYYSDTPAVVNEL